jgi:hypothetical protein
MFRGAAHQFLPLNPDLKEKQTIRHYLLGQAMPDDSSQLEEGLLTDSALFQELLIVEDELVDQYLSDELSPNERQSFETHFLVAPEHQRKLGFGRALHRYMDAAASSEPLEDYAAENLSDENPGVVKPPPKRGLFSFRPFSNPLISYSLAAAILLIVGGVSWLVLNNWRQQTPGQSGTVYVATLTPGLTRAGGEFKRLSFPPDTSTVQLRLVLKSDEDQSYRAELLTSERASVLVVDDLKPQTQDSERFIILSIPTRILKRDDYEVKVSGRQAEGSYQETDRYQFRVVE